MKITHIPRYNGALRSTLIAFTLCLTAAMAVTTASAQFLSPKLSGKQTTVRRVLILPAKVDVVRDSMKGPEGMAAESDELSSRAGDAVAEVLTKKKNITALPAPTAASGDADPQAKYAISDIQSKFDDLLPKIAKKRSDVKKGRFTMGEEVLDLNLDKSADAIVFIRGQGRKLTSGKQAFRILVGGVPAYMALQIVIVDAHTGEVLLYSDPMLMGDPTTANDRLRKALEKGFKKMPAVTP